MKFVLLWVLIGSGGSYTSGSAEFDSRPACESAGAVLRNSVIAAENRRKQEGSSFSFQCSPKG